MKVADIVSLDRLVFVHVVLLLIHASSVIPMYHFSLKLTGTKSAATKSAIFYGLFPPLIYLQLFVMSEAIAIPAFIWSIGMAITITKEKWMLPTVISSILFSICITARLSMAPAALVVILCALITIKKEKTIRVTALFSVCLAISIIANIGLERFVTSGKVHGLTPNSSIAYLIARCHPAGYAFNCPECSEGECALKNKKFTDGYGTIKTTFAKFMNNAKCVIPKGGAGVTSKVHGDGVYYIFNSPPWDATPVINAANQCHSMNYSKNVSYLFLNIDNIGTILSDRIAIPLSIFFSLLQLILLMVGIVIGVWDVRHNLLILPILIGFLIPVIISAFFISNLRYMLPYILLFIPLYFLHQKKKSESRPERCDLCE